MEESTPGQPQSRNECYFTAKGQNYLTQMDLNHCTGPTLPRKLTRQEKPWTESENLNNKITSFSQQMTCIRFISGEKKNKTKTKTKQTKKPPPKQTKKIHKQKNPVFNAAYLDPLIY